MILAADIEHFGQSRNVADYMCATSAPIQQPFKIDILKTVEFQWS